MGSQIRTREGDDGPLLDALSSLALAKLGIAFPKDRRDRLRRFLGELRAISRAVSDSEAVAWLAVQDSQHVVDLLAQRLTIGETYFFRYPQSFQTIIEHIARPFFERGGRIFRVLSAGCSTGDEAYTLAILLDQYIAGRTWYRVEIMGVDINPEAIEIAQKGWYKDWSLRNVPRDTIDAYFEVRDKKWRSVVPRLKAMTSFQRFNLATNSYPSLVNGMANFNLILCENVLMYFDEERRNQALQRLHKCLVPDGWLLLSACEVSLVDRSLFRQVNLSETLFYQKRDGTETEKTPSRTEQWYFEPLPETPAVEVAPVVHWEVEEPRPSAEPPLPEPQPEAVEAELAPAVEIETAAEELGSEAELRQALERNTLNPMLHFRLASLLMEQGRLEEAQASLRKVLYLDDRFVLAHFLLGTIAMRGMDATDATRARRHMDNARAILKGLGPDSELPASDGLTVGALSAIIDTIVAPREGRHVH